MQTTEQIQVPAAIRGQFSIALTQSKFQELQNKADRLIYNEEHLEEIASFLKSLRSVGKAIEETHKNGKAEALRISREWDAAKRVFIDQVAAVEAKPQAEYSRICREIEERRMQQEREKQRKDQIKEGIETNALRFASDIAKCTTSQDLAYVERIINLEKSKKTKYQEFLDDAVARFTELNNLLASQKVRVKELEELKEKERLAAAKEDDESLIELQEQRENLENKIEESKIIVQETAINQSLSEEVEEAEVLFPAVKARRSVWSWEVKDIKETAKKMPAWTTITPIEEKIDEYLKAKKAEGINVEEFEFAGIRFFLKKTY